ncbi:hypothetical protein BC936DRAFT_141069 [Jimgerdemannia flammicorona]|uniref:Uncharacterized protein n=1 Tax=Jimgerdemannia flammicorona TaxID=994334 RepID=A0A433A2Y8_9FUNG|nr:hypothetical protein BC936DRAFT_141069 [Jimgerdemannia flammicorona]
MLEGVEVEMFFNPAFQYERYRATDIRMGAGLINICGPERSFTTPLASFTYFNNRPSNSSARALPLVYPTPPRLGSHATYAIADQLRDLSDVISAGDSATANLLLVGTATELVHLHHRLQRRWRDKPKRLLQGLTKWDVQAAELMRVACEDGREIKERRGALETLAEYVLRPLGRLMPVEWESPWEELKE